MNKTHEKKMQSEVPTKSDIYEKTIGVYDSSVILLYALLALISCFKTVSNIYAELVACKLIYV